MVKIYSQINNDFLAMIVHRSEIGAGRTNYSDVDKVLQVATIMEGSDKVYDAHRHHIQNKSSSITGEVWVIISGSVQFLVFDYNKKLLFDGIVQCGDCLVTYRGYHAYRIAENTVVYEIKTGPYKGKEFDKVMMADDV